MFYHIKPIIEFAIGKKSHADVKITSSKHFMYLNWKATVTRLAVHVLQNDDNDTGFIADIESNEGCL